MQGNMTKRDEIRIEIRDLSVESESVGLGTEGGLPEPMEPREARIRRNVITELSLGAWYDA